MKNNKQIDEKLEKQNLEASKANTGGELAQRVIVRCFLTLVF